MKTRDDVIHMEGLSRDHLRCAAVLTAIAGPFSHFPSETGWDDGHRGVSKGYEEIERIACSTARIRRERTGRPLASKSSGRLARRRASVLASIVRSYSATNVV